MEFDEVQERHGGIVQRTLNGFYEQFGIDKSEHEAYRTNALSELWENTRTVEEVNASFVLNSVRWSCFRTFRESHIIGDGGEGTPEMELFCEESEFSKEMYCNNRLSGLHVIDGDVFPDLPELADLDKDDLAVIQEFCDPQVTDRSRRTILRRRVDLILLKLGIDSSDIHEYTSRNRERRGTSGNP